MASPSDTPKTANRPDGVRVTAGKCPRCGQPVTPRYRPFCSERCSDLDLAGWLTGRYRLPTEEAADISETDVLTDEE